MRRFITDLKDKLIDISFINKADVLCITVLMFIFAVLSFIQLGYTHAPETAYSTTDTETDIVLDFGEYTDISSITLFLGHLNSRQFSISAFNEVTGSWEIIQGEATAESVFAWNTIDIHYNLRYLGIVSTDASAVINELVVTNPEGMVVIPINSSEYPALFDEQTLYPGARTYMSGAMFDEVYHGRTAFEFLHELTTYETTHPPLGKSLISIGISIFGMNPFGWRFMSVIFGILMIPLMYLFAKRLFDNTLIAAAAALLVTFDCMHYTLSRIATIDIFAAFFILLMYYFLYDYFCKDSEYRLTEASLLHKHIPSTLLMPLGLCGISMAFGIATKWTGVYAGIGLGILFFTYTLTHFPKQYLRLLLFCCVFFIIVPLAVYTLSYLPVIGDTSYDNLLDKVIRNTQYMFQYHANLDAEHYYGSPFYEWPVIWMPLLYASDAVDAVRVSAVSCMGNPVIWWSGIPCVFFILYRFLFKRDKKAGFLFISYLAQYVPWMFVGRITFIYHYFPSLLFVILMIGYTLQQLITTFKWGKKATCAYLAVAVICFFIFLPVISGIPVVREWGLQLRWLKDWILVL